jgi:hypothetical protein
LESLQTVLWVVHEESLQQTLAEALGLQPANRSLLSIIPFTFTVLHYPATDHMPILQAMNLHHTGRLR